MDRRALLRRLKYRANAILKRVGLKVIRHGSDDLLREKLHTALEDIESIYRECVFIGDYPKKDDTRITLMTELCGTQTGEALYIVKHLTDVLGVSGDVCEFGVAQGATSALMANEIMTTNKKLWLFDSFEGLPRPTEQDKLKDDIFNLGSIEAYAGTMASNADSVRNRLTEIGFPQTRAMVVPGFIEETIKSKSLPTEVAFAYIDFDFYEPIKIALEFLDRALVMGGCAIVDDYDYFSTGAKQAVDEFISANQIRYSLEFPKSSAGHFCIIKKLR